MPRAYADVVGNFRRGEAGAYARGGDYRRASETLAVDDPEMSEAYRRRAGDEEEAAYRRGYGSDIASGNYEAAIARAGKTGDVQGVAAAREGRTQADEQQRIALWRGAQQNIAELEAIDQAQGQGYEDYLARAQGALAQNPNMDPEMASFIQSLPPQWNPRVTGAARTFVTRLRDGLLTPEQSVNIERESLRTERARRRPMSPEEVAARGLRPGTVAEIDGDGNVSILQQPRERPEENEVDARGERDLRREFQALQGSFRQIRDAYAQIDTLTRNPPTASGDVALIFSFMKMLDPTSVVREGEQANAQNATGVPQQVTNTYNRLLTGQRLNETQRADFVTQARSLYQTRMRQFERDAEQYRGIATDYGYNPDRVVLDQATPEGAGDGAGNALPPVNEREVGEVYTMPDGRRARWNGPGRGFTPVEE